MRKIITAIFILMTCAAYSQESFVLYNANVVDVKSGQILPGRTVTVKNGIIESIQKANKKMAVGAMDCSGKYVMPGLIDSHVHWANFAVDSSQMTSLADVYTKQGVTTVRDVGGDGTIIKRYNNHVLRGEITGPKVYFSSFWAGKNYFDLRGRKDADFGTVWTREINPGDDYRKAVIEAKDAGCMGLKLYADLTGDQITEIAQLCRENGVRVWGHFATNEDNAQEVVNGGVTVVSHIYYLNELLNTKPDKDEILRKEIAENRYGELFKDMVRLGTVLDPTITISTENGMDYVTEYLKMAHQAGVKIVAGTDYIDITDDYKYTCFLLHELNLYVDKCGLTTADALRAATINGAEILGMEGVLGEVSCGAEADLLVLDSNPLESLQALRNIHKVITINR